MSKFIYRCMRCGNNSFLEKQIAEPCQICDVETQIVLVTEENRHTLPQPSNPITLEIDINNPGKSCNCKAGTCPCGEFIAHRIDQPCTVLK